MFPIAVGVLEGKSSHGRVFHLHQAAILRANVTRSLEEEVATSTKVPEASLSPLILQGQLLSFTSGPDLCSPPSFSYSRQAMLTFLVRLSQAL